MHVHAVYVEKKEKKPYTSLKNHVDRRQQPADVYIKVVATHESILQACSRTRTYTVSTGEREGVGSSPKPRNRPKGVSRLPPARRRLAVAVALDPHLPTQESTGRWMKVFEG